MQHNHLLSNSAPCNSFVAKRLSKCRIKQCTYYSYVEAGTGAFMHLQVVKTSEHLKYKYKYPAMTDYEAAYCLEKMTGKYDLDKMFVTRKGKRIKLHEKDFENCISWADKLCTVICVLLEMKSIEPIQVMQIMDSLKELRQKENEKI